MSRSRDEVRHWFGVSDNRAAAFKPTNAIFPGYRAPIVRLPADGERELDVDLVVPHVGDALRRPALLQENETSAQFWKSSFEQRRCLVPASSSCETKGEKPAIWHWFAINVDGSRPLFAFPGI